jgi:hypothetical protein
MHRFQRAGTAWWQKPLVIVGKRASTAELAVLAIEVGADERGAWLNSRGRTSGVVDLIPQPATQKGSAFRTQREALPQYVAVGLDAIYRNARLLKGCPDLVIWRLKQRTFRLVEVKCPHWDKPTPEQEIFIAEARRSGIDVRIVEWEFTDHTG